MMLRDAMNDIARDICPYASDLSQVYVCPHKHGLWHGNNLVCDPVVIGVGSNG